VGTAVGRQLSDEFGIKEDWLNQKGVFNPTLDIDAPLFIDPFLLPHSRHREFRECAFEAYESHFGEIYRLLRASERAGDKAWKAALGAFRRGEVKGMSGTCLGYSKHSTHGRAFGPKKSKQALIWAKEVIEIGVKDPELFSALSLFEGGIGPDLISDMVASITLDCIIRFNDRILREAMDELGLRLPIQKSSIQGREAELLPNPYDNRGAPVILLASDILKYLPLLEDPRKLSGLAEHNADLRKRVNLHISEVFKIRFKKEREAIKKRAMESGAAFQALLDLMKLSEKEPYDLARDPAGLMQWRALADQFSGLYKVELKENKRLAAIDRIEDVVRQIIAKFKELIEERRMNRIFLLTRIHDTNALLNYCFMRLQLPTVRQMILTFRQNRTPEQAQLISNSLQERRKS
jgi:hypothetical protein